MEFTMTLTKKTRRRFRNAALVAGVIGLAAAAGRLAPSPTTVAVVDLGTVFNGLDAWTAFQDQKVSRAEAAQADAGRRRSAIEELQADLEDYPESSDRHESALRDLQLAAIEYEASLKMAERRLTQFETRAIRNLYESIRSGAEAFGNANGYDLVLVDDGVDSIPEDSTDPIAMISSRRVLFAGKTLDITEALIGAMNTTYRAENGG
jgi:Skp family chaperone for outer membrane proteins